MAQTLLSNKLQKKLHIALFVLCALFGLQANAQSVLLPGDVVIVSANADAGSIDFIPLIDIERGTTLYFSNGLWNNADQTLNGSEIKLTFNEFVPSGTNLQINAKEDPRFAQDGKFSFEGGTHRVFAYQKEQEVYRFIFGMGWGKGHIWSNDEDNKSVSEVPLSLSDNENTLLTLGEESNQQYYIRNGASGTRDMLLSFVGDSNNWRGSERHEFPSFGTSFNLLAPPVVQFSNSISFVNEADSIAVLNLSLYEHDGSRMSVEVEFDTLRSIASADDYEGFTSKTINFTGLVGDYTHAVEIPITDDVIYEGRETGIFNLKELSAGNLGDFLSHNLVIEDNEQPEVIISRVATSRERSGFVEIKNMEEGVVSLDGWTISGRGQMYIFSEDAVLMPNTSLQWIDASESVTQNESGKVIVSGSKSRILSTEGGVLTLKNFQGRIVHQVSYSRLRNTEESESKRTDFAVRELAQNSSEETVSRVDVNQSIAALKVARSGWKVISGVNGLDQTFTEKNFYTWNEQRQSFENISESSGKQDDEMILMGFFESDETDRLASHISSSMNKTAATEQLRFKVSATDLNNNDHIDGVEGLNMAFNTLNKPISVQGFLELIKKKYPKLSIDETVYGIRQLASGSLEFIGLNEGDTIAPKSPFWIALEGIQGETVISLKKDDLNEEADIDEAISSSEADVPVFGLTLKSQSQDESKMVQVQFSEEEQPIRTKDLNSYPELFLPDQSFLNFSIKEGKEYFRDLTLYSDLNKETVLPLHLSSSTSGRFTFSVTEWERIPADWRIVLVDQKTDKEYNLRRDFSVTVEHNFVEAVNTAQDQQDRFSKAGLSDSERTERFVLKVSPAASAEQNEQTTVDKPRQIELHQNYPNPFNPVTTISFYLPQSEEVRLSVFNIVGQPVAVIVEGTLSAGQQHFEWDATDKPSGMYIYQLEVGNKVMTRKMTLVK